MRNGLCLQHSMKAALKYFLVAIIISVFVIAGTGCANIIPPGGGPRDSIPPVLISATPPDSSKNVKPVKITLTFNEYLDQLQNVTENVIISPTVATIPQIDSRLRTVTIRLKDTLEPNTTYSINFGDAIKDVNEGNVLKNFTYVFSTGKTIDENTFSGKVINAETGKVDSTLIAVLHRDLSDSAIVKQRPRYYSKIDGRGNFTFHNLPPGQFNVYIIENGYLKQYDDTTRFFAFLDKPVTISDTTAPVTMYVYQQAKPKAAPVTGTSTGGGGRNQDRRLRYINNEGTSKDVLSPLQLDFNRKLKTFDSIKFILSDTNFNRLGNYTVHLDSTRTKVTVQHPWKLDTKYKLIILKDAVGDNDGINLLKNDTLSFTSKRAEDYGSVKIRFNNIDLTKNPVLQIVQNDVVIEAAPLSGREYKKDIFKPGEYELRILYDQDKNGVWTPGNFKLKKQPEIVLSLNRKLSVKPRWENEEEINLGNGQ
jgi:hypothetical protein